MEFWKGIPFAVPPTLARQAPSLKTLPAADFSGKDSGRRATVTGYVPTTGSPLCVEVRG